MSLNNLGKTNTVKLVIKYVTEEPVVYQPYRMPAAEKHIVRDMIQELLDNTIIQESQSAYANPILLIKKKTGDYRLCVDYRHLNAITVLDHFPLPLTDDQRDKLEGNKYFCTLELASGFYQVPVDENLIHNMTFVTPEGHYEFLRMLFDLTNAPSVFQCRFGFTKGYYSFPLY